jgi:hypothetical protein
MELHLEESNINEQIEYIYTFFKPEATARNRTVIQKIHYQERKPLLKPTVRNYIFFTNLVKKQLLSIPKRSLQN